MANKDPQETNFEAALEAARGRRRAIGNRRTAAGRIPGRLRKRRRLGDLLQSKTNGGGKEGRVAGQRQGRKDAVPGAGRGGARGARG